MKDVLLKKGFRGRAFVSHPQLLSTNAIFCRTDKDKRRRISKHLSECRLLILIKLKKIQLLVVPAPVGLLRCCQSCVSPGKQRNVWL